MRDASAVTSGTPRLRIQNTAVASHILSFPTRDYDLAATLSSGQAFRWRLDPLGWTGVIGRHWVRFQSQSDSIAAELAHPVTDSSGLTGFLQTEIDLGKILRTFPADEPLGRAVESCRGLRLLRQEPWECLASFILSSTKRITQIQQIVDALCRRFGDPLPVPPGEPDAFCFPTAERLARCTEGELRDCKMGFRAPNLLATARQVMAGKPDLESLRSMTLAEAREILMQLPGVGRKIADCVLLFAYGQPAAFPLDVWVFKALKNLYFPGKCVTPKRLREFSESYFGPNAGYAQQYLFHYMRTQSRAGGEIRNRRRRGDAADLGLPRR